MIGSWRVDPSNSSGPITTIALPKVLTRSCYSSRIKLDVSFLHFFTNTSYRFLVLLIIFLSSPIFSARMTFIIVRFIAGCGCVPFFFIVGHRNVECLEASALAALLALASFAQGGSGASSLCFYLFFFSVFLSFYSALHDENSGLRDSRGCAHRHRAEVSTATCPKRVVSPAFFVSRSFYPRSFFFIFSRSMHFMYNI